MISMSNEKKIREMYDTDSAKADPAALYYSLFDGFYFHLRHQSRDYLIEHLEGWARAYSEKVSK